MINEVRSRKNKEGSLRKNNEGRLRKNNEGRLRKNNEGWSSFTFPCYSSLRKNN
jgi:hypothetical protein